jgi:hypothetical protein
MTRSISFNSELSPRKLSALIWRTNEEGLSLHLAAMQNSPSQPLVTVFRYNPSITPDIAPWSLEVRAMEHGWEINWDEYAARLASSGGRMQLHLMIVLFGGKWRSYEP